MIRHRPLGRGHPYVVDPDQRFPARPSAGAAFDLGITTTTGVRGVEIDLGGTQAPMTLVGDAVPRDRSDWGAAAVATDGHLAGTSGLRPEPGRIAWTYRHPGLAAGETLRYRFRCEAGDSDWFELRACEWVPGTVAVEGVPRDRLLPDVTWLMDGDLVYALRFALRLEPGERVVGFGERFDALDQRGRRLEAVVFDQYKNQGGRSYLPMPFAIVVGGGFGFHVDTGRRVRFDVGASDPGELGIEVDLEPGVRAPDVTLRLFAGDPAEVRDAFAGPVPALPEWAYRLWMSGNGWNTQERLLAEVQRSLDEEIAPGVAVIEAWSDETTFTVFDSERWPDPKGVVDWLHERDVKVLLWQIPLARPEAEDDVATMIERGYCVRDEDGTPYRNPGGWFGDALLLDVTSPEAVRWWTERRRWLVEELGVDGFKTDGGEHAWSPGLRYADGTRGGETNNRYPVLYAHAYHELLRSAGREPLTFSRAGFTGSQSVPAHWAGDQDSTWEALRSCITAGLSAAACGIAHWSFDIGGFSGPLPSPELYLRSAAFAALSPIMQYHAEFGSPDRTPWNVGVVETFRGFVQARERLVREVRPLMQPLFFATSDERAWAFPYQYLLGEALLVAPVVEPGVEEREVFLPAGEWLDPVTGAAHAGGAVVTLPCPLDRLPVLVAAARAEQLLSVFEPVPLEV